MALAILMRFWSTMMHASAAILLLTGGSKLYEATQQHPYFREPDSVVPFMSNRGLIVTAAFVEMGVAVYLLATPSYRKRGLTLIWLSSLILIYKVGIHFTRPVYPCSCLGVFSRWLKLSWGQINSITWLILLVLATASIGCLFQEEVNNGRHGMTGVK